MTDGAVQCSAGALVVQCSAGQSEEESAVQCIPSKHTTYIQRCMKVMVW